MKCVCTYNNGTTCHIVQLYIFGKGLNGPFPMDVLNLKYLTYLDFGQNYLYGHLPPELGNLTDLYHFAAGTNLLTGPIPVELGNLKGLRELYLDTNFLSGVIPAELANLNQLSLLWLLDNNLTGPLPDIFHNMSRLSDLRIYGNSLQGPIPGSIQQLRSLQTLYIGELESGGTIPEGLSNLRNLTVLSLRNNGLTGSIPAEIGNLQALKLLDLSFNALNGSVPNSFGNLSSLESLYLGNNMLTGSVPESLLQIMTLKNLDISFNQLEGNISLLNQSKSQVDVNAIWNSLNGTLQLYGMKSTLPLLDCASNMTCGYSKDENFDFAINAGGLVYHGTSVTYDADSETTSVYVAPSNKWTMSSSGGTKLLTSSGQIIGANDSFPLLSARQALSSLRYLGLGMENGAYTVELQFAEIGFGDGTVGRRYFDVYIQDVLVLRNFDIQKTATGSNRAITLSFPANVSNNILNIHFFWAGKGTCCIPDGYQDYGALVSAIHVYSGFSPTNNANGHSSRKTAIVASTCVGAVVLLAIILFLLFQGQQWTSRSQKYNKDQTGFTSFEGTPVLFSLSDMQKATNRFHAENKLGEGGFGSVYKGLLPDDSYVAVKVLSVGSRQGQQEFMNEVKLITAVQHRNLVKLKGCCLEGGQAILVYEYLENSSLDKILFDNFPKCLDWGTRFEIILGVARGIVYLHEECQIPIIHRDIKASNILLDTNLKPKIADFGLARLFTEDASHVTTKIAGTRGYMAPEYAVRGKLTVKADVYSFGVLVLEIVSGRRNQDSKESEEKEFLIDWAWSLHEQNGVLGIVDPLLGEYPEDEVLQTVHVALLCVLPTAQMRPTMSRVISMLLRDIELIPLPAKPDYIGDSMWEHNYRTQKETISSSLQDSSVYSSSTILSEKSLL
ncbi:hypothetical protein KP509_07G071600 [Ceratopteris richardii]|nr:hypothetical protein KP509_07G071600 [Ceratopteris richardii]